MLVVDVSDDLFRTLFSGIFLEEELFTLGVAERDGAGGDGRGDG